ncbi:MAG: uncharacterized protein QOK29_2066 [Rhodospirillaceae bacterium]|nr:uncharacterized protein [Rhodospirillaceae bacterium]
MDERHQTRCTAFEGSRRIAAGGLAEVALKTKEIIDRGGRAPILIFDDVTSKVIEVDFRGTAENVLNRLAETTGGDMEAGIAALPVGAAPRGPGRPKLGVVAREVTLLPRHWDWLSSQPGGASVALRRLVDEARRANEGRDRVRQSQESAYRFMAIIAGDLAGFEEAARALFAGNRVRFDQLVEPWPTDVRDHLRRLARPALERVDNERNQLTPGSLATAGVLDSAAVD